MRVGVGSSLGLLLCGGHTSDEWNFGDVQILGKKPLLSVYDNVPPPPWGSLHFSACIRTSGTRDGEGLGIMGGGGVDKLGSC